MDVLRIGATAAVVLLHTITGVWDATDMSGYPVEHRVFLVAMDLITWCVPVFVLISGYLFLNPRREISFRQMLWKYCRRIVLALLVFGVPYAWLELAARERAFRPGMLWEGVLMVCRGQSWSHLWYLYMILGLYLLTPLLKRFLARCPRGLLYLLLAFLAVGSSVLPFVKKLFSLEELWVLPDGGIYPFYYLCGYLFAAGKPGHGRGAGIMAGSAVILLAAGMAISRLGGGYGVQMAYNYPFTVILSLNLFFLFRETAYERACSGKKPGADPGVTDVTSFLSELCFGVYLVHPVFVNIAYKFLHITPLDFPIGWSLPVFFAVNLGLSVPVVWALRKLPGMAGYVL